MSLTTGVHGAAGHSSVDVKDDDGSRAGTVRDDAGSLGGYLNLTHTSKSLKQLKKVTAIVSVCRYRFSIPRTTIHC